MVYHPKKYLNQKDVDIQDSCKSFRTCPYLVIVESPSKILSIGKHIGKNYQIIASNGHICNIRSLKDIDIKNCFEAKYSIIDSNKSTVEYMRSIIENYDKENIFLATDSDVEGEKIAFDICEVFNLSIKNTKRIIFNEITGSVLKTAIQNPKIIDINMVRSQQARQIVDMLIGFTISPLLCKYISHSISEKPSCGRCQSIALKLIYENDIEFKNYSPDKLYKTIGYFFNYPHTIALNLSHNFTTLSEMKLFLELSKTFEHELNIGEKYYSIESPPKPFNTSTLLQKSGLSPVLTMKLAQQLYTEGKITYVRTDSKKYSREFIDKVNIFLLDKYKNGEYVGNTDKIMNENEKTPHEAIRVTDINVSSIEGDKELINLYNIIYTNSIESCMSDANYDSYDIEITSPLNHIYKKTVNNPTFLGWKIINSKGKIETCNITFLRYLKKCIKYQYIESNIFDNNKISHYNEIDLIKKMESLLIGRPSTFISYGQIVLERGYAKLTNIVGIKDECIDLILSGLGIRENKVEKVFGSEKNVYIIQENGILNIKFLLRYFEEIFSYSYTVKIEKILDKIKNNCVLWSEICQKTYDDINNNIKNIKNDLKDCEMIDDTHELIFTSHGPIMKHTINEGFEYLPLINEGINLEKLINREYSAGELVKFEKSLLGYYDSKPIFMRIGKYGEYLNWNDRNFCIKDIKIELKNVTLENAILFIEKDNIETDRINKMNENSKTILRIIDKDTSIRNGYYGPYIYHKSMTMKKPKFVSLKSIENFLECDKSEINKVLKKSGL